MTAKAKLKINTRGKIRKHMYTPFLLRKAKKHGIETHEITHHKKEQDMDHVEVIMVGEKNDLWEIVHWHRKNKPKLCNVEEILIQFVDVSA